MKTKVDLSLYDNSWYNTGGGKIKRVLWYFINALIFDSHFFPFNGLKIFLLKIFGANVGKGVVIKPKVNIKYPWNISIGDYTWIGEGVWLDSLVKISIGKHCCISQGAYLLTGNHDYRSHTFDLILKPIEIKDGVWIGAKSIVCPGVVCESYSMLTAGSVISHTMEENTIYKTNSAFITKKRFI
jgi:putative colanic acid biosynthesis acetyltransferase WcaF